MAGLWIEPVMGAGGIVPLPKDYIQRLYAILKKHGGLYISDEVLIELESKDGDSNGKEYSLILLLWQKLSQMDSLFQLLLLGGKLLIRCTMIISHLSLQVHSNAESPHRSSM